MFLLSLLLFSGISYLSYRYNHAFLPDYFFLFNKKEVN